MPRYSFYQRPQVRYRTRTVRAPRRRYGGRSRRGRGRGSKTRMGLFGWLGAAMGVGGPMCVGLFGNGSTMTGAHEVYKAHGIGPAIREFFDILSIQFAGIKMSTGEKWMHAQDSYSGWKWVAIGGAMIFADSILGKLTKYKSPKIPFVNVPIFRGR